MEFKVTIKITTENNVVNPHMVGVQLADMLTQCIQAVDSDRVIDIKVEKRLEGYEEVYPYQKATPKFPMGDPRDY